MRVLLVEDDQSLNQSLATQLEKAGYAVDRAEDGREGLYYAQEYPIDLAIVDLGLPTVSGVELIKQVRADGKAYPILVLTARDRWQDKVEALKLGADDYVVKPFHVEELLARVDALLRRASGWAQSELVCGPIMLDTRTQEVKVEGREARADELRVQAARVPDAARRRGAVEDADHRGALRRGLRARQQRDRGVHRAPAQEARSRNRSTSRSKRCAAEAIASRSRAGLPIPPDSCQSSDAWPSSALFVRASFCG